VAREVQDLDPPVWAEPRGLTAAQPRVYRGVAAELPADPIQGVLVRAEAVGLGPAVDLREHDLVGLYVGPVGLATGEPQGRVSLFEGAVAAAVVYVSVADDDLVYVLKGEAGLLQIRDYDLLRRPGDAGVYEDDPVLPY
jgi:hypothetical protein